MDWGQIMELRNIVVAATAAAFGLFASTAGAQMSRESGVSSVAGVLTAPAGSVYWTFTTYHAGEIMFVTVDGEMYKTMGAHSHEEATTEPLATEPVATDHGEEGGPGRFYIEVQNAATLESVCFGARPAPPPGWMRDPRLACVIANPGTYKLIVGLVAHEEGEATGEGKKFPFVANISLRAPALSGQTLPMAVVSSKNHF
jgi:hypothetical protein